MPLPIVRQEAATKATAARMEMEAQVTELEDLLQSNLLKRQQELQTRLQQADVEADRYDHLHASYLLGTVPSRADQHNQNQTVMTHSKLGWQVRVSRGCWTPNGPYMQLTLTITSLLQCSLTSTHA